MEHYFTNNPNTKEEFYKVECIVKDTKYKFTTNNSVFSKKNLDFGSRLMIETVLDDMDNEDGELLDMGCGYGPVGIIIGKNNPKLEITFADVNNRALNLTKRNINDNGVTNKFEVVESDVYGNIDKNYDYILTNPPIRAGKKIVHKILEESIEHLNKNGVLYVVIQKKQGAPSAKAKLIEVFGNCEIIKKSAGYNILKSIKE